MKLRKLTALLLVLCILFLMSLSAFAADAPVASGTIQSSGIRWSLDTRGWLTVSGTGTAPVFQSANDQPWAAYREQIVEVWYDDMSALTIPDLAYHHSTSAQQNSADPAFNQESASAQTVAAQTDTARSAAEKMAGAFPQAAPADTGKQPNSTRKTAVPPGTRRAPGHVAAPKNHAAPTAAKTSPGAP